MPPLQVEHPGPAPFLPLPLVVVDAGGRCEDADVDCSKWGVAPAGGWGDQLGRGFRMDSADGSATRWGEQVTPSRHG